MNRQSNEVMKKWYQEYREGRLSFNGNEESAHRSSVNEKTVKILYKKMFKHVSANSAQRNIGNPQTAAEKKLDDIVRDHCV